MIEQGTQASLYQRIDALEKRLAVLEAALTYTRNGKAVESRAVTKERIRQYAETQFAAGRKALRAIEIQEEIDKSVNNEVWNELIQEGFFTDLTPGQHRGRRFAKAER